MIVEKVVELGVFPDVTSGNGLFWLIARVGNPQLPGHVGIFMWEEAHLREIRELASYAVPSKSPAFPRIYFHAATGHLWFAYHDGSVGWLHNATTGQVVTLAPCQNNDPICFGGRWVAWQGAQHNGWPITRMDLETGQRVIAGHGAGTGLSRILESGEVRLVDEDRVLVPGGTRPCWAADLVVVENFSLGVLGRLNDGREKLVWPGMSTITPRCAYGSRVYAIATWLNSDGTIRVAEVSPSEFVQPNPQPPDPPRPPENDMIKPIVTVNTWTLDELLDGREFVVTDTNNPVEGYKFRVYVENGSMHAQITNAKGTAKTGMVRPVKKCPEVPPVDPPPVDPPPVDPPPIGAATIKLSGDKFFRRADGSRMTVIQASEFSLFKRYLDNDSPTFDPVIAERRQVGFNTLRVWLLNHSVVAFRNGIEQDMIHPSQYPDFYPRLTQFVDYLGTQGFCVELTVFTQTETLMPDHGQQQEHLNRTADAIRGRSNVILETVNENDQHDNEVWDGLSRPEGVIISHGSNGADQSGVEPVWDYTLYHTNGLNEWWRKTGHNAMEKADDFNVPAICNENTRYPDSDSSTTHAYDAAAGASLLCAGACFHSQGGKFSRTFDPTELAAAQSWVTGALSVPLEYQAGQYLRRDDLLTPELLRVYERRLSDGRGWIVKIRK